MLAANLQPQYFHVVLAEVAGLRSHAGGRYQPRYKKVASSDPQQIIRVEKARYASTEIAFRRFLQNHFREFTDGNISNSEFYETFSKELYRYEIQMYMLGRRVAGDYRNTLTTLEKRKLHGRHASEMKYFNGFMGDFLGGKGKMPYAQRLDLYALDGYSLFVEGAVLALPNATTELFGWKTNPQAENCPDCIYRESESNRVGGFTLADLQGWVGFPGDGRGKRCLNLCRCGLEVLSGTPLPLSRSQPTAFSALANRAYQTSKSLREPHGKKVNKANRNRGS